jgi:hypothetical protein
MKPTDRPADARERARELFAAGYRTPVAMIEATWPDRVDTLGRGHCKRYDESTAGLLEEFPGTGPAGASSYLREVRDAWPPVTPYVDDRMTEGARRAGLPAGRDDLAALLTESGQPSRLAALARLSHARNPSRGKTAQES